MTAGATRPVGIRGVVRTGLVLGLGGLLLTGCSTTGTSSASSATDVAHQGYQSGDGSTRQWAVGARSAPVTVSGTDFAGATHDVTAWRGSVVVLNSWYAACPPCRAEAPTIVAFANDYAAKGVHVLGINGTDDAGTAEAFQRTFNVPYPSIADTSGHAIAALQGAVPVQAVPTTVVLDRQGRVAARILGIADPATLRGLVDDVLAEGSGAGSSPAPATATP